MGFYRLPFFDLVKITIMDNKNQLYTDKEVSELLRVSQVTLWRERRDGKITFRRIAGKIIYLQQDIDNYLEKNKRGGFAMND